MSTTATEVDHYARLEILEKELSRYLALGEIDKPAFERLKYKVDRAIQGTCDVIAKEHLWGKGGAIYNVARDDKHWAAFVSAIPVYYAREVLALGNKLARVKNEALQGHAFYKDVAAYYARYRAVSEQLGALKDKVVTVTKRREQKKEAADHERKTAFTEHATLVAVLQEHLDAYVTKAGKVAAEAFSHWMKEMAAVDWDIDRAAPVPVKHDTEAAYKYKERRRTFLLSITDAVPDKWPLRKQSIKKKAEYVAHTKDAAHTSYMNWIYKMIQKIGQPVTTAEMHGNPWVNSRILVVCGDGTKQMWHTQMIINRSKYNYPFNQFPSRRVGD